MSDLDRDLTRVFQEHADTLGPAPLAFDDVRGRATSIRRRRRVASGLAVAAAVAVIVPTAMVATKGSNSDGPLPPATGPTVVTDTADPTPAPTSTPVMGNPHALDFSNLPTGAPPKVDLVTNGDFAVATTAEARVRWTPDGVVVEAAGKTFGPYPGSSGLARNAAGTAVAWATDDGQVMTWQDGYPEPNILPDPGLQGMRVAAVTGDGCVNGKTAGDCLVYVSGSDQQGQLRSVVVGRGAVDRVDPDGTILSVRDAEESGRLLGIDELDEARPGTCSVLLDPATSGSQPLLRTCDYALDEFSPDGSYVLASDTYGDGIGSSTIAVFATAGDRLAFRSNRSQELRFYNSAVWEDDTHVLFTQFQDGQWAIVRMDVNGAMELALAPQDGTPEDTPWHFAVS